MAWRYPLCRSPKPVWRQACSTPYALPAGIALAVVSAVLTASNTLTLQSRVHGYAPEVIHRAAGWLGAGNMPQAAALLPDFSLRVLRESYDSAYTLLFSGLAVVTLLCALMIWLTLCRKGALSKPATVDPEPP